MDIKKFIIGILVILFVYFFRPWFHSIAIYFYKTPVLLEVILIWGVIYYFFFFRKSKNRKKKKKSIELDESGVDIFQSTYFTFSMVLLFGLLIIASFFSSFIVLLELPKTLEFNEIQSLPESTTNLRLMPMSVAYRYAKDSLQLAQYRLGPENIVNLNDSLSWSFPLVPDGELLQFLIKNKGIVVVDATVQEKNSQIIEKDLDIGEGMQVFDNLFWNLYKKKYFVDLDDTYYTYKDGEIYTIIPVISYKYKFYYGLLYTLPEFDGLFVVDSAGKIQFLEPNQALETELLKENRIFPENLARLYIESYAFKNGLINYFFIHKDQTEIQDLDRNTQPFLLDTEDGLKWFISTEPYGASHGIFKIFLIDARTGKIELLELPGETLTGPVKATDFVRKSNPIVDWIRFGLAEPLPFFKNNSLYWKVVVVPVDSAGIAYQAFVNAETNEVIELDTNEEILNFVKGTYEEESEEFEKLEGEDIVEQIKQKISEIEKLLEKLKEGE
jgi:hypothetical protein